MSEFEQERMNVSDENSSDEVKKYFDDVCEKLGVSRSELIKMLDTNPSHISRLQTEGKVTGPIKLAIKWLMFQQEQADKAKREAKETAQKVEKLVEETTIINHYEQSVEKDNEAQSAADKEAKEITENSVEEAEKKDEQVESLNDGKIHYVAKYEEIVATLKELGISTQTVNGQKDIINLSNFLGAFETITNEIKGRLDGIKMSFRNDQDLINQVDPILKKIDELKKYFGVVSNFFLNPQSQEVLELANRSSLIKKIFIDFDNFVKRSENHSLTEGLTAKQKLLTEHLNLIDDFVSKFDGKIENIKNRYDEFGENVAKRQEDSLKQMESRLNGYIESSDNTVIKISNALKTIKGGVYGLIASIAIFCIITGIMASLAFWEYSKFDDLQKAVAQFGDIGVNNKDDSIVLTFPVNAKFSETKNSKQIQLFTK